MTYNDIIQKPGRRIKTHVYYEYNSQTQYVSDDNVGRARLFLKSNLIGTAIKGCELKLKEAIQGIVCIEIEASYEDEEYTKTYGPYIITEEKFDADTKEYTYTMYDNFVKSMVDYEPVSIPYPNTVYNYFVALANDRGYINNIQSLPNGSRVMINDVYNGIGYTYRDVFEDVAKANGILFYLDNNEIKIAQRGANTVNIDDDILTNKNIAFGEHYGPINAITLSRSADSDIIYIKDDESIAEYGLCEFKIKDNELMNFNDRGDYLQALSEELFGVEYDIYDTELVGYGDVDIADEVVFETGNKTYTSYIFNDEIVINKGYKQTIYNQKPEEAQTDFKKSSKTDKTINQAFLLVDKQALRIDGVVSTVNSQETRITQLTQDVGSISTTVSEQIGEQNQKISTITQNVNEINQKIQDIADITVSGESGYARVELLNVNPSEPITVRVKPITTDITCYYPENGLYPSNTLYPKDRILRFTNTTTSETWDYQIPDDLLYYNNDNVDEFELAYGDGTNKSCTITKKVEHTSQNGVNSLKQQSEIIEYPYPSIYLTEGDYTVELLGYTSAYLYVQLMASNIYTTQFATHVELESTISQTKDEINLEVSKKVDNDQVIASINLTSEQATINASKINIQGTMQAINNDTTTTINGNKITTGSITADKVSSDIITTSNLSAQTISADNISGGTISGRSVSITNLNASNITSGRLNITSGSYYLRMGFNEGNNPSVSGLNVGGYGIRSSAGINATSYNITNGDTGKSASFQVPRQGGGWYYITFTGGILTKYERN